MPFIIIFVGRFKYFFKPKRGEQSNIITARYEDLKLEPNVDNQQLGFRLSIFVTVLSTRFSHKNRKCFDLANVKTQPPAFFD